MKFLLFAIFFLSPFLQAKASTPKAATCTRKEYREEYLLLCILFWYMLQLLVLMHSLGVMEKRKILQIIGISSLSKLFSTFYIFLRILVVDINVPNKTSEAPNKKFMFIISLKNKIPQIDPNKTCK